MASKVRPQFTGARFGIAGIAVGAIALIVPTQITLLVGIVGALLGLVALVMKERPLGIAAIVIGCIPLGLYVIQLLLGAISIGLPSPWDIVIQLVVAFLLVIIVFLMPRMR